MEPTTGECSCYNCTEDRDRRGRFDLQEFSYLNKLRMGEAFAPGHGPMALVACVAEELGEISACVLGIEGEKKRKKHLTVDDLGEEIADAVTYLDLLASSYGLDLATILRNKFNKVSDRSGSIYRLP